MQYIASRYDSILTQNATKIETTVEVIYSTNQYFETDENNLACSIYFCRILRQKYRLC
jgi:hypothetical protein